MSKVVGPDTFIIGHSLDSDFRALGISHQKVIDTAVLYPHTRGLPFKNSMKVRTSHDVTNANVSYRK